MDSPTHTAKTPGPIVKFGTFGGVFIPNVLTILGVIMFLRTGWVVGNAGLGQALVILCIANAITILTTLSLSAIATNGKVGGGGAYYLISRSLGLEIGGSIGVPLYLAQAISVAFYVIGFTESLAFLLPDLNARLASSIVLAVLFLISWCGAALAIKAQYIIMGCLGASLLSFFLGYSPQPDWEGTLAPDYLLGQNFWTVFAIFFPAVTGIMAGVSMSGDLKDPSRSIPRGTLAAVCLTWVIYAGQMFWLARNADRAQLIENALVMKQIAKAPMLIFVGLWAATLSSGLASLLAAPRTLQALGQDRVLPRFLARGWGPQREPRLGLALSALLAEACILLGDLNLIAPLITMFFLTTYGMTNLVAGLERLVANPSYRPTFHVHWLFSLIGAVGCLFVMFLLNTPATLVAVLAAFGIYSFLKRREYQTAWGDARSGIWFALTRFGLLRLSASRPHLRNWRPVILVLAGPPKDRLSLVRFSVWLEARRGLLFLAQIVVGDWQKLLPRQEALQKSIEDFIQENQLSAVAKTVLADNLEHGVSTLLQVAGLGYLQPNTVLLGWSDDAVKQPAFTGVIKRILQLQKNLLVFAEAGRDAAAAKDTEGLPAIPQPRPALARQIDVWWRAKENGSFMLTLAHLLRSNHRWEEHQIRVLRIIEDENGREQSQAGLQKLADEARINVQVEVIVSTRPPLEVITSTSKLSEVCFIGLAVQDLTEQDDPLQRFLPLVTDLKGNLFLTKSWHDLAL